jgi:hypothetical protein
VYQQRRQIFLFVLITDNLTKALSLTPPILRNTLVAAGVPYASGVRPTQPCDSTRLTTNSDSTIFQREKIRNNTRHCTLQRKCIVLVDTISAPSNGHLSPNKFFVSLSRMSYFAVDLKNDGSLRALQEMRPQHESVIDV